MLNDHPFMGVEHERVRNSGYALFDLIFTKSIIIENKA